MKKIALLLAVVMVMAMAFTACGGNSASTSTAPSTSTSAEGEAAGAVLNPTVDLTGVSTLDICVGPDPDTIDPALNSSVDGGSLIVHAFEGLYTLNADATPVEGQAESVEVSEDGLVYTFKLRDGLKWSNGEDLTAEDFVYSWARAINPETAADYEYMFAPIKGYADGKLDVVAKDATTLVVTLNAPCAYFLELTAFPAYCPVNEKIIEEYGEAWAIEPDTYVGNGPYMMAEWVPGSHITYVKNENYWNVDALGSDALKFVLMEDDTAILNAYQNGDILFADQMPNDEIDAWSAKSDFYKEAQLGTYYVSFNVTKAPLDNAEFRKALILAVDRDNIVVNIGKSGQMPAGAFVPGSLSDAAEGSSFRDAGDYYNPNKEANADNLAEAKAIIQKLYPDGNVPAIEYLYNEGTGHQQVGEALQADWAKIGVKVEIVSQEWATFLNTRKNGDYYIARNGWLGDYNDPLTFLDMWMTGGGNNDAQWSNAEYDDLINLAMNSSDRAERYEAMHKAEDLIFEDWMLCPLDYYVDIYLLNEKVDGFYSSPLGFKYFMYATAK
ncbi:MAG: peptide ABC transporter substrate-binding protein [Oscillospiraceae bacterium]|nr:peptide ABC transporter substrate-binding protein [Oscillospiraceae bacterium]